MTKNISVSGKFGVVHVSVITMLRRMSYREARQWLRYFGFTKAEQDEVLRVARDWVGTVG